MTLVVPAVLPSSRKDFEEKLALFSSLPHISRVQIDVVDGKLATPASFPYTAPEEFQQMVHKGEMLPHLDRFEYEIDLMCFDAERAADAWLLLGATRLTFHPESSPQMSTLLSSVQKRHGGFISLGLALNIATNLSAVRPCLDAIEYVQFMGIAQIGRQGQPFDERVFEKIIAFKKLYPNLAFQIDGGVSLETAKRLLELGAAHLVVGSALSRASNPVALIAKFEEMRSSSKVYYS